MTCTFKKRETGRFSKLEKCSHVSKLTLPKCPTRTQTNVLHDLLPKATIKLVSKIENCSPSKHLCDSSTTINFKCRLNGEFESRSIGKNLSYTTSTSSSLTFFSTSSWRDNSTALKLNSLLVSCSWTMLRSGMTTITLLMANVRRWFLYVPVKSKLQHPPGQSPGHLNFWKMFGKFPPPEAEKLFKCPIIGPFQVIKCPQPRETFR